MLRENSKEAEIGLDVCLDQETDRQTDQPAKLPIVTDYKNKTHLYLLSLKNIIQEHIHYIVTLDQFKNIFFCIYFYSFSPLFKISNVLCTCWIFSLFLKLTLATRDGISYQHSCCFQLDS